MKIVLAPSGSLVRDDAIALDEGGRSASDSEARAGMVVEAPLVRWPLR